MGRDIGLGHGEPGLECAHLHVVEGDFGQETHQNIVEILPTGFEVRLGRLYRTTHTTEHVQFPGGIEAHRIELAFGAVAAAYAVAALIRRSRCIDDGKQSGPIDASEGPCLSNTSLGVLQIEISTDSALHQAGEGRVLECRPPLGQGLGINGRVGQAVLEFGVPG